MASRLPLGGAALLLGCAVLPRGVPPGNYGRYLTHALAHVQSSGPSRIRCSMNPKAPPEFQAKFDLDVMEKEGELVVLSGQPGQCTAAWFGRKSIRIADRETRSLVRLPPVDPARGGAETGQAAEVMALRLLLAAAAPSKLLAALGGRSEVSLTDEEARDLIAFFFPDLPHSAARAAAATRLSLSGSGGRRRAEWADAGGALFWVEAEPADAGDVSRKLREFEWVERMPPPRPRPNLRTLLAFLRQNGIDVPRETAVAVFTPRGAFEEGSPHLEGAPVGGEMASFLLGPRRVALSIGGAGGVGVPGLKRAEASPPGLAYFQVFSHGPAAPDGAIFAPEGQDWALSFTMGDGDADLERRLSALLIDFLKDAR